MSKVPYDSAHPDMRLLREVVLARLRQEPNWTSFPVNWPDFDRYVDHVNPHPSNAQVLVFHIREVLWQLIVEGVVAPGSDSGNLDLPNFHVTKFGHLVLDSGPPNPYDPAGYLASLRGRVNTPDTTVMTYLSEALDTFRRSSLVSSAVMLGVAAERVFDLLCGSLLNALANQAEKKKFGDLMDRFQMKPKLIWVRTKVEAVQAARVPGFPDNAGLVVLGIYDLMRQQRNDLGHPREQPPVLTREDLLANLQVFVRYYETAEAMRSFLANNKV